MRFTLLQMMTAVAVFGVVLGLARLVTVDQAIAALAISILFWFLVPVSILEWTIGGALIGSLLASLVYFRTFGYSPVTTFFAGATPLLAGTLYGLRHTPRPISRWTLAGHLFGIACSFYLSMPIPVTDPPPQPHYTATRATTYMIVVPLLTLIGAAVGNRSAITAREATPPEML